MGLVNWVVPPISVVPNLSLIHIYPYTPLEVATAVPYVPEKKVFADSPKPFEKFCIGRAI